MFVSRIQRSPQETIVRFSSTKGTTSAIVASAASGIMFRSTCWIDLPTRFEPQKCTANAHASLNATPAPHSSPNG